MYDTFAQFISTGVLAFLLIFVRIGTAIMIVPGIGDSFVSMNVRLLFAVAMSFAVFPVLMPLVPNPVPGTFMLFSLLIMEFVVGLFIGSVARVMMTALDTAGMVVSTQSGLANAQIFNPSLASQGSLIGAFLSVTGVVLLFATDLHHLILLGVFESYQLFPLGSIPDAGSMAELMSRAVTHSFMIGIKIGLPFFLITMILYTGMGVLARVMPQIQVFILTLPVQILLALTTLTMVLSVGMLFWLREYEAGMVYFLSQPTE
ncbi:MAG: flagellar biosynthetic protein FliR [Alphaproteobacteria bacterium]|nr:flagellar biosynthetic protein FliR [Alphaproteobacteria bacterium]MCD8526573.1 flagellar biosynthetic protein FliR [Alphaproteobacteria bacterium]MCD8570313.1 flagellar biosynthetic protein FliR [Alphaproteobacteria bacterium]